LRELVFNVGVVLLALIGLYVLLLAFTAATPAIFVGALLVLALVVVGIVWLRRNRRSAATG
jgi:hypothetical protein